MSQIPEQDPNERRVTGLKIPTPWGPLEVRGLSTIMALFLVVLGAVALFVYEAKLEHAQMKTEITKVAERVEEQTYVLTLEQKDREALNLRMPHSLRQKLNGFDR